MVSKRIVSSILAAFLLIGVATLFSGCYTLIGSTYQDAYNKTKANGMSNATTNPSINK